jgi:hypothetical protein
MTKDQVATSENETTAHVARLYRLLDSIGPINVFEFFINPQSFSETIENLFHLSFLIRDGKCSIRDSDQGIPILEVADPPTDEDYRQGAKKKQTIVHLDYEMYLELIEKYELSESVIPMRETL